MVPGIGPITASAHVASIGDAKSREPTSNMLCEVVYNNRDPSIVQHHDRCNCFTEVGMLQPNDCGFKLARKIVDHILDLLRIDMNPSEMIRSLSRPTIVR